MQLSVREVARLLNVAEDTVYGWVNQGRIPFHRLHGQYRFGRAEIIEWAAARKLRLSGEIVGRDQCTLAPMPTVAEALSSGGVFCHVAADDITSVLRTCVAHLSLPEAVDRELLLQMALARKELLFSLVGDGIAIPKVRNPIVLNVHRALMVLIALEHPVVFGGAPIRLLFMLITPTLREHLRLVSRLAAILGDGDVLSALERECPREAILAAIKSAEGR